MHRDIKPGNILLDRGTERVRVADFGLVRVANDASCTRSGVVAGTPQYMSPEQVRAELCDGRSDLFSLGSVMYALCTGHPPFRAETVYGVMQRIVHDRPRGIRQMNASVPEWLDDFILRLLAKDRAERFASADEVAALLSAELAHLQNPDSAGPRRDYQSVGSVAAVGNRKQSHRQYVKLLAGIGALIIAIAGIAASVAAWNSRDPSDSTAMLSDREAVGSAPAAGVQSAAVSELAMTTAAAGSEVWRGSSASAEFDALNTEAARLEIVFRGSSSPEQVILSSDWEQVREELQRLEREVANRNAASAVAP